jgi:DNA-binding winged helix-turn-helix (wHTH) protein
MRVRFGEFSFDSDLRELRKGESERHLSPKGFELLRFLIENRARAVSKTELHERLWPATFVSDATVTSLIAEVRAALGEEARRERFVRTVHRFGYGFQGTVTDLAARAPVRDENKRCCVTWEWGQVALTDGDHIVGRGDDVAVWLESPTVSRHHARIRVSGGQATITDLGSKNGTHSRGERLTRETTLEDGDSICVGSVELQFRRLARSASTETLTSN